MPLLGGHLYSNDTRVGRKRSLECNPRAESMPSIGKVCWILAPQKDRNMNLVHILQPTPFFLIKENLLCTEKIISKYSLYITTDYSIFSNVYICIIFTHSHYPLLPHSKFCWSPSSSLVPLLSEGVIHRTVGHHLVATPLRQMSLYLPGSPGFL